MHLVAVSVPFFGKFVKNDSCDLSDKSKRAPSRETPRWIPRRDGHDFPRDTLKIDFLGTLERLT